MANKTTGSKWISVNEAKHADYIDRRIDASDKREVVTAIYGLQNIRVNNRIIRRTKTKNRGHNAN